MYRFGKNTKDRPSRTHHCADDRFRRGRYPLDRFFVV